MKTSKLLSTLLSAFVLFSFTGNAKNGVNSETTFGMYKVGLSQQAHAVAKNTQNSYTIYYEEFDTPVTVSVFEKDNCKNYVVRTKDFEVQYTCNGKYFGVKFVNENYATMSMEEMKTKINRTNFLYQRCITKNIRSEKEFVRLIACYLPEIMNS